ncbi:MAG: hypothetical protein JW944_11305 [Deltaproteobacteria bacterium]|nr:hypothetical protein [Deltaproteobacteria bacterium]
MEDQKRKMDGDQQVTSATTFPKEAPPGSHDITIMIMKKVGRIRSFTISYCILFWLSIFLSLYFLFSLFIISHYMDMRYRYRNQSKSLADLEEKYNNMEKGLLKAQQRAANLEAYIESTTHKEEAKDTAPVQMPDIPAEKQSTVTAPEKIIAPASYSVDIEGLDIRKSDPGIVIDFRLTNTSSGTDAVEGYLHIIVSDQYNNYPSIWNSPSREITDGIPSQYRSGERFIIQRFKQYHREFTSESSFGVPARITIIAYDPSGNLILRKEFEVRDA